MKVAVDFTPGVRQWGGVGRYTRSLVKALAEAPGAPMELRLLWAGPPRVPLPEQWPNTRTQRLPLPERWMTALWQRARVPLPADLLAGGASAFYSPDFALPPLWRAKSVVTVHDLSYLTHPETHYPPLRAYLERAVPRSVRRADVVLADSQQTKRDLVSYLGVPESKIEVVLSAADATFRRLPEAQWRPILDRLGIRQPYILSVGTIQPRKNLPTVFQALERLERTDVQMVHVGRKGWLYEPILEAWERSPINDRVRWLENSGDDDLVALYNGAVALVFPSLYEGFGIPCLEAMACGTPVIASHGGSLAEVVEDAGIVVGPHDAGAIAEGIRRLMDAQDLRSDLVRRGEQQAARFTWEASGRQLRAVLERLAS